MPRKTARKSRRNGRSKRGGFGDMLRRCEDEVLPLRKHLLDPSYAASCFSSIFFDFYKFSLHSIRFRGLPGSGVWKRVAASANEGPAPKETFARSWLALLMCN